MDRMRILCAPDGFGSVMTAQQAADAMADGWGRARPQDVCRRAPQSDGGPGFVDVLAGALRGRARVEVRERSVTGPLGVPVPARWLRVGGTAYIESAQACGLHLLGAAPDAHTAWEAGSAGVGELLRTAVDDGAGRLIVGLGGSACTDGGAGAAAVFGGPARMSRALSHVGIVAAADVRSPMLGADGAAAVFGPQKGADPRTVTALDKRLRRWCAVLERDTGRAVGARAGAGAAGGLGGLLLAIGAGMRSGVRIVGDATGRGALIAQSDIVLTGEGRLDAQSTRGKVVGCILEDAAARGVPALVVAGRVEPGWSGPQVRGEVSAHAVEDVAGTAEAAMHRPRSWLAETTRRVADARAWDAQSK